MQGPIGMDREREAKESVLSAHLDDDNDNITEVPVV